jgi:hypothetical protein
MNGVGGQLRNRSGKSGRSSEMAFWYNVFVFDTPCCVINGLFKKWLEILQIKPLLQIRIAQKRFLPHSSATVLA